MEWQNTITVDKEKSEEELADEMMDASAGGPAVVNFMSLEDHKNCFLLHVLTSRKAKAHNLGYWQGLLAQMAALGENLFVPELYNSILTACATMMDLQEESKLKQQQQDCLWK